MSPCRTCSNDPLHPLFLLYRKQEEFDDSKKEDCVNSILRKVGSSKRQTTSHPKEEKEEGVGKELEKAQKTPCEKPDNESSSSQIE